MTDPKSLKPPTDSQSGRVKHDARGNAVWDWLKETGRIAIESTSRLLRKLDVPEMKIEGEESGDNGLRLECDRDAGGGYDPYNRGRKTGRR